MSKKSLMWFTRDLRVHDNPALVAAAADGAVVPLFIWHDEPSYRHGSAHRWWLHHSLAALNDSLDGALSLFAEKAEIVIARLAKKHGVQTVHVSRAYEPWAQNAQERVQSALKKIDVELVVHNALLLWEPECVLKSDGTPYKVFTPFFKHGCLKAKPPRTPLSAPNAVSYVKDGSGAPLASLDLLDDLESARRLETVWDVGEKAALRLCDVFMKKRLAGYADKRDFPAQDHTSHLSPSLHFGEISPHTVWHALHKAAAPERDKQRFAAELGWREFSYTILFFNQALHTENYNNEFNAFEWGNNKKLLHAWQNGMTGVPLVDAGMRELLQTGYMHNRVRMVVASFLTKNILHHWREGAAWFWQHLVDADLANNSASWQWVAGSGVDAAPYFRIFNPETQAKTYDADGQYIKKYLPELAKLPAKFVYAPWKAPASVLAVAGVVLGKTYPYPIVDLSESRKKALAAYKKI